MKNAARVVWLVMTLVALAAPGLCLAVPIELPAGSTHISVLRSDGTLLFLSTGTTEGRCTAEGPSVYCQDGSSFANADLAEGCGAFGGEGYCLLANEPAEPGHEPVVPDESRIDVKCATGLLKGMFYTLSDGDGDGSCGVNRDIAGRVNGATCTKDGQECSTMNCDEGCTVANRNCHCDVKRSTTVVR